MRRRFRRSTTQEDAIDLSDPSDEVNDGAPSEADTDVVTGEADGSSFDALLARELAQEAEPVDDAAEVDLGPADRLADEAIDPIVDLAEAPITATTIAASPIDCTPITATPIEEESIDESGSGPLPGDFWDRYDQAMAEAELSVVPPAAIVAVVGPLEAAIPVVDRCRDRHWIGRCDVFVLSQHPSIPARPDWSIIQRPSDLVAVLEDGGSDFPLLVLDVPCDLPAFVRPLVATLRDRGVGLIHYVLDDQPADEDLATWHGELGQPSVLDLTGAVPAERVLELVDRGEPVVSVAGNDLSTELLLALRIEQAATAPRSPSRRCSV